MALVQPIIYPVPDIINLTLGTGLAHMMINGFCPQGEKRLGLAESSSVCLLDDEFF